MSDYLFLFLIVLAVAAAVLRAEFVLTVIYLLLGVYTVGRWWGRRALKQVEAERDFPRRSFLGEKIQVQLKLHNKGFLPVVWLQFQDNLPMELTRTLSIRRVTTLGPYETRLYDYTLEARKRGYYTIGPLVLYSGDLFGLLDNEGSSLPGDQIVVYPKILPLQEAPLNSRSPMGNLRHHQPIYEDPSRTFGKRDYTAGDSLRRVDWKASAALGRLQVKQFEPSIALETSLCLDLNAEDYPMRGRYDATELAIVVAASLANWAISRRQSAGLISNGADPLRDGERLQPILPGRGRGHLTRILEALARAQMAQTEPLSALLRREIVHLPWGTTLVVLSPRLDDAMFEALFQARRAGMNVTLLPTGSVAGLQEIRQRAEYFGFPLHHILEERDLERWRQRRITVYG